MLFLFANLRKSRKNITVNNKKHGSFDTYLIKQGGNRMENKGFLKNQVYENVYFIFVDASGHSNVVRRNPKDVSTQAFDLIV